MDTDPIIKHGSVTRLPGHLIIHKLSLQCSWEAESQYRMLSSRICIHTSLRIITENIKPARLYFHNVDGIYYYVDGKCGIWKTDIKVYSNVVFNPFCWEEYINNGRFYCRMVKFEKLHRIEALFS
jgi:hypothetical protein